MPGGDRMALAVLAVAGAFWMVGAGGATRFTAATARQLTQPGAYVDAVMRELPVPPHVMRMPR